MAWTNRALGNHFTFITVYTYFDACVYLDTWTTFWTRDLALLRLIRLRGEICTKSLIASSGKYFYLPKLSQILFFSQTFDFFFLNLYLSQILFSQISPRTTNFSRAFSDSWVLICKRRTTRQGAIVTEANCPKIEDQLKKFVMSTSTFI